MMISEKISKLLNQQLVNEYYAHVSYVAMSYAFEALNLKGYAAWFMAQANEEMTHAHKIARYLLDQDVPITFGEIPAPRTEFANAAEIVQSGLDHELMVTKQIHKIAELASDEKD